MKLWTEEIPVESYKVKPRRKKYLDPVFEAWQKERSKMGIRKIDYQQCIGCGLCVEHCPMDVIRMNQERKKPFSKILLEIANRASFARLIVQQEQYTLRLIEKEGYPLLGEFYLDSTPHDLGIKRKPGFHSQIISFKSILKKEKLMVAEEKSARIFYGWWIVQRLSW